jgi:hypothetical protein
VDDPAQQMPAGDAWWNVAESLEGVEKAIVLRRARHWYQQAAGTTTGLAKSQLDKRLADISGLLGEGLPPGVLNSEAMKQLLAEVQEKYGDGLRALHDNRPRVAERAFLECLTVANEHPALLNNLAVSYAMQRKIAPAFKAWERSLAAIQHNAQHPAGEPVGLNLVQLAWGARYLTVSNVTRNEYEAVTAIAEQYVPGREPPGKWMIFPNPADMNQRGEIAYKCLQCTGDTTIPCPVTNCRNGKLLEYRTVNEGNFNQTVPTNRTCGTCNGAGRVKCPSCAAP